MNDSVISTIDDVVESKKPRKSVAEKSVDTKSGRFILTIYSSPDSEGQGAVFISPGNESLQIPRDKPWEVSAAVVDGLRNAVVTTTVSDGKGGYISTDRPRYAFSAVPA